MGEVYLAHDTRLHRPVAIKMVHPDLLARPEVRARFVREARIAASIVNPFVATVFDVLDCMAEAPPEGRELVAARIDPQRTWAAQGRGPTAAENERRAPCGWINCYRMDLASENDVDVERCSSYCIQRTPLATEIEEPVARGTLVKEGVEGMAMDLVARRCWTVPESKRRHGNCNLLWLDSDDRAEVLGLQFCAPNIKAVVVVANLRDLVGGGLEDALAAGIGLIVLGSSPDGKDGDALAGDFAAALLEHEFGHLFGLADEYTRSTGPYRGDGHAGRIAWRPTLEVPDGTQSATLPADMLSDIAACADWVLPVNRKPTPSIPWRARLDTSCADIDACHGSNELEDECCVWSPTARDICPHFEVPGRRAGPHHIRGRLQRTTDGCLMKVVSPDGRPCEACRRRIQRALCEIIPGAPACGDRQAPSAVEQPAREGPSVR